jgi:flagella basal body P-ring formation protein FlgA
MLAAVGWPILSRGSDTALDQTRVEQAIAAAIVARVGRTAQVSVSGLSVSSSAERTQAIVARPDPGGRIGQSMRFVLVGGPYGKPPLRLGEANAVVHVTAEVVRTRRPVVRGAAVDAEDVATESTSLAGRSVMRLPSFDEVVGARTRRDLGVGELVTKTDILAVRAVRSGEHVRTTVRVGAAELGATLVAVGNGSIDDVIQVVNPQSRRTLRAKVIGKGEVEVVDVR